MGVLRLAATMIAFVASDSAAISYFANVKSFGAMGNGVTFDTQSVVEALQAVQANGGGTLYFPPGTYLMQPVNLTSNLILLLDDNATLLAAPNFSDWTIIAPLPSYGRGRDFPGPRYTSFLHGYNLTNVRITSNSTNPDTQGSVVGQGASWWEAVQNGSLTVTPGHLVEFLWSDHLEIDHVTFVDSPFWNIHPWSSSNIHIHDIRVRAPIHSTNTDGIDPDSCQNVLLERLDISTGDDCIAVKSGWNQFGVSYGVPTLNVTVRDMVCSTQSGCIAIGSEMSGGVADVYASNITCVQAGQAINIKSALGRGGFIRNITVENAKICEADVALAAADTYKDQYPPAPVNSSLVPIVDGIFLSRITTVSDPNCAVKHAGVFEGLNVSYIQNVVLNDIQLPLTADWTCVNVTGTSVNVQPTPCVHWQLQ